MGIFENNELNAKVHEYLQVKISFHSKKERCSVKIIFIKNHKIATPAAVV